MTEMLIPAFLFVLLGLAVGSFGNVLLVRLKSGESLWGRSRCVSCRRTIPWYDLLPVVSYVFLWGRCRKCHTHISLQYSLVELGSTALFFLALMLHQQDLLLAGALAVLFSFLFFACVFDARYQRIPDLFTAVIALAALAIVLRQRTLFDSLLGATSPLVWFGGQWALSRGRWVGAGDVLLASALGFWLGAERALVMLVLSYMVGAVVVTLLLVFRRLSLRQKHVAFVPFLAAASLLAYSGTGDLYLSLFH
ncbi:MAG: prepilin peptidase [Candidatus Peribacteraceae bacterium]